MIHLIGEKYREKLETGLLRAGADVIWLPDNPSLDPRLSGHADLSVCFVPPNMIVAAQSEYDYIVNKLTNYNFKTIRSSKQEAFYPKCAGLCVCLSGRYVICNDKTVDPVLMPLLSEPRINVPQGFTNCAICMVRDDALITSDDIIAQKAEQNGLDVLKITPGMIELPGYDYGFIGGASAKLSDHSIAFTGKLDEHIDYGRIMALG